MSNPIDNLKIKNELAEYLGASGGFCSWEQLMKDQESRGRKPRGDVAICCSNPNLITWLASPDHARAIVEGIAEGLFHLEVTSSLDYMSEGVRLDLPILSTRKLGFLLRDWAKGGSAAWIDRPVWIPTLIFLAGVEVADLLRKEITPQMLQVALDSGDTGTVWLEKFDRLSSEGAAPGSPSSLGRLQATDPSAGAGDGEGGER